MIVFGGYMHKHKEEEACYDDKIYVYHLGCHVWVSHQLTSSSHFFPYPKQQGIYGHSVFLKGGNTMVVVGGFHGIVNGHVLAYVLPGTLVAPDNQEFDTDEACRKHNTQASCVSNLECGWCPTDISCYDRSRSANCTNNLQTSQCPGLCAALHTCQSCVLHGRTARNGPCSWCVQTSKCHDREEVSGGQGRCGSPDDNPNGQEGWWGPRGNDLVTSEQCRLQDYRPGMTFIRYRHPVDLTTPDYVAIVNATYQNLPDTQDFRGARDMHTGGSTLSQFLGFIHPIGVQPLKGEINLNLFVQARNMNASLWVSKDDKPENMELVVSKDSKQDNLVIALRQDGGKIFPVFSKGHRYLTKLEVHQPVKSSTSPISVMRIDWNAHTQTQTQGMLTLEYLEPYGLGGMSCMNQTTCLACLMDAKCGWCQATSSCVDREHPQTVCMDPGDDSLSTHFLTLVPDQCVTCEQYIYCDDCVSSGLCEWLPDEAYCSRKGRFPGAVMEMGKCPAPCHKRKSCTACLGDPGRCAWCQESKECFLFSVYTSVYQYGSCRVWLDEDHTNISSLRPPTLPSPTEASEILGTTLPYLTTSSPFHGDSTGSSLVHTLRSIKEKAITIGKFQNQASEFPGLPLFSHESLISLPDVCRGKSSSSCERNSSRKRSLKFRMR
ncbi:Multiple epidermal growth factor-like domains protein 8 [Halocaridina rubra]|uniref:Multiple epidermal growth factor-like domains protein 8 n=1 Tax=Halocaridina rubra TaxID=373956 RepID=A0AAN8X7U3_HALRR